MTEITLGLDIIGTVLGISALNVGVIIIYVQHLHKETEKDFKEVRECINSKFNAGKEEHERLDKRIDKIAS